MLRNGILQKWREKKGQIQRMWQSRKLQSISRMCDLSTGYSLLQPPDSALLSWFEAYHWHKNLCESEMGKKHTHTHTEQTDLFDPSSFIQMSLSQNCINSKNKNTQTKNLESILRRSFQQCNLIKLLVPHACKSSKTLQGQCKEQWFKSECKKHV